MCDAIMQLLFGADERKGLSVISTNGRSMTVYDLLQMQGEQTPEPMALKYPIECYT